MSNLLDYTGLGHFLDKLKTLFVTDVGVNGNSLTCTKDGVTSNITVPYANVGGGVLFGTVDVDSPNVAMTATVPGLTELKDGVVVYIANNVVSASTGSWTLNVNNLGAKPIHSSQNLTKIASSDFAKGKTFLLVYSSNLITGGGWIFYIGDYKDSDVIAYKIRGTMFSPIAKNAVYNRSLLFLYSENEFFGSATSYSNTDNKELATLDFNPFGNIFYADGISANDGDPLVSTNLTFLGYFDLRYAFKIIANPPIAGKNIYLKCEPLVNANGARTGRVKFVQGQPLVQDLPEVLDNYVYIFLGWVINEQNIYLCYYHPIYEYKEGAIRLWTNQEEHLALTSEEIDRDIIRIVQFLDPVFKLVLLDRWKSIIIEANGDILSYSLENITTLPSGFMASTNITSIEDIAKFVNVNTLGPGAFNNCSQLTSIHNIPSNIKTLGQAAFSGCSNLISVTTGDNLETITNGTFNGCTSLTTVTIGDGVKAITDNAFNGCSGITSLTFGNSLETISSGAFYGCTGLTTITFPDSLKTIDYGFCNCSNLSEVILNEGLLTITNGAFWNTNITSIIIPSTVTTIGAGSVPNTISVVDFGNTRVTIPSYSDSWQSYNVTIVVPDTLVNDWKASWTSVASKIVGYSEYHND